MLCPLFRLRNATTAISQGSRSVARPACAVRCCAAAVFADFALFASFLLDLGCPGLRPAQERVPVALQARFFRDNRLGCFLQLHCRANDKKRTCRCVRTHGHIKRRHHTRQPALGENVWSRAARTTPVSGRWSSGRCAPATAAAALPWSAPAQCTRFLGRRLGRARVLGRARAPFASSDPPCCRKRWSACRRATARQRPRGS